MADSFAARSPRSAERSCHRSWTRRAICASDESNSVSNNDRPDRAADAVSHAPINPSGTIAPTITISMNRVRSERARARERVIRVRISR